jgi:hypothetical protein
MPQNINAVTGPAMTLIQAQAAWLLAADHGHEWTIHVPLQELELLQDPESELIDPQAIFQRVEERRASYSTPGIAAPNTSQSEDGLYVWHTTGTGRLSWEIDRDGRVTLLVFRPERKSPVLEAVLAPVPDQGPQDAFAWKGARMWAEDDDGAFYYRHLRVIDNASALLAGHGAWKGCREWAQACGQALQESLRQLRAALAAAQELASGEPTEPGWLETLAVAMQGVRDYHAEVHWLTVNAETRDE